MSRGLNYSIDVHGQWSIYHLEGVIADSAEAVLDEVTASAPTHIIFDFAGITGINSTGIADWLDFIDKLAGSRHIIFDNCSPAVVEVVNMISGFYKGATIRSVLLPYGCSNCANEWFYQLNVQEVFNTDTLSVPCPKCQTAGTVDVDLEEHLFFREAS